MRPRPCRSSWGLASRRCGSSRERVAAQYVNRAKEAVWQSRRTDRSRSRARCVPSLFDLLPARMLAAQLGPVLVEPLASRFGDCEAGWLLGHPPHRALVDQSIERIRQSAEVQSGSRGRLKLLERHTGCTMLGS